MKTSFSHSRNNWVKQKNFVPIFYWIVDYIFPQFVICTDNELTNWFAAIPIAVDFIPGICTKIDHSTGVYFEMVQNDDSNQ